MFSLQKWTPSSLKCTVHFYIKYSPLGPHLSFGKSCSIRGSLLAGIYSSSSCHLLPALPPAPAHPLLRWLSPARSKCPGCQLKHRVLILCKSDNIESMVWCRQTTMLASCSPQLRSSFLIDSVDHLAPVGVGPSCNKDNPASQSSGSYLHPHKRNKQYEELLLHLLCASHRRFEEQVSSRIEPQQKRPDQWSHQAPATALHIICQYSTSKNHPSQPQAHVLGRGHRTGSP